MPKGFYIDPDIKLYEPPKLDLSKSSIVNNSKDKPSIKKCAESYYNVMRELI